VTDALKNHWPEYLIEGACLGLFMISAFSFGTIFEHPGSQNRDRLFGRGGDSWHRWFKSF